MLCVPALYLLERCFNDTLKNQQLAMNLTFADGVYIFFSSAYFPALLLDLPPFFFLRFINFDCKVRFFYREKER